MVELEDDWVRLATVDARVLGEIRVDHLLIPRAIQPPILEPVAAVLGHMCLIVLADIHRMTGSAIRPRPRIFLASQIELGNGQPFAASRTPSLHARDVTHARSLV